VVDHVEEASTNVTTCPLASPGNGGNVVTATQFPADGHERPTDTGPPPKDGVDRGVALHVVPLHWRAANPLAYCALPVPPMAVHELLDAHVRAKMFEMGVPERLGTATLDQTPAVISRRCDEPPLP
jgi:hypothetical protein